MMIFELMNFIKTALFKDVIDTIIEYNHYKAVVYETLENISSFAKTRKKFINSYYVGTNELSTFRSMKNYRNLGDAVNP